MFAGRESLKLEVYFIVSSTMQLRDEDSSTRELLVETGRKLQDIKLRFQKSHQRVIPAEPSCQLDGKIFSFYKFEGRVPRDSSGTLPVPMYICLVR